MDLSLQLEGTHVLITGAGGLIGSVVKSAFLAAGSTITCIDISFSNEEKPLQNPKCLELQADTSSHSSLNAAWNTAVQTFGPVSCCIALAALDLSVLEHHDSIADMSVDQFRKTLDVNVTGTFLTAREWVRGLRTAKSSGIHLKNVNLIIVGSESGHWGERSNCDYSTSKSAVQGGLLQSLKGDVPRIWDGARVNAIAPGAVDTPRFREECKADPEQMYKDAIGTVAMRKPVAIDVVARSIVFLASEHWSGNIHGQVLNVDSGKMGKVMWMPNE